MQRYPYKAFFRDAFGNQNISPYPYQVGLAESPWPDTLEVPTGLGKTAAIVLAWLYKRLIKDDKTPRRLVYCLPLRTLVEQTAGNARDWIRNLSQHGIYTDDSGKQPAVYILMGGEIENDWDRQIDQDVILIGSQDQLLSRALNRGYAMSRFRWPVQFGLLHSDTFWVFDEIQLSGPGLATSTQLEAFRRTMGTIAPCRSIWTSATMQADWLSTVDFQHFIPELTRVSLTDEDKKYAAVKQRIQAPKHLYRADCKADDSKAVAKFALQQHRPASLTLVVVNTVERAQKIYGEIRTALQGKRQELEIGLLHSRFRPGDRKERLMKLLSQGEGKGRIVVSTQVVEADMDLSAATLITDLAPWSSMIQRFGRVNRYGEQANAEIYWLDIEGKQKLLGPYVPSDITESKGILESLEGESVSPEGLPAPTCLAEPAHVLRRKDMLDLFDTSSDLTGNDIDISRFIRDGNDQDVFVFWRDIPDDMRQPRETAPEPDELCSVPIYDMQNRLGERDCWVYDHIDGQWQLLYPRNTLIPGSILLLRERDGGYSSEMGWTGEPADRPGIRNTAQRLCEAHDSDYGLQKTWETLQCHTEKVVRRVQHITQTNPCIGEVFASELITAAIWHDLGKAHPVFQNAIREYGIDKPQNFEQVIWGKAKAGRLAYRPKGFRHELASALALLANGHSDLAAYLAAAHHGKVRLSLRSVPDMEGDVSPYTIRGIRDNDVIAECPLTKEVVAPESRLRLDLSALGGNEAGPSWLARMLKLRDDPAIGPFRLAYMEALLRVADWLASEEGTPDE